MNAMNPPDFSNDGQLWSVAGQVGPKFPTLTEIIIRASP